MRLDVVRSLLVALIVMVAFAVLAAGRPRRVARSLPIDHNGVHAPYNVKNRRGQLLFYNFRAVEPGVLYRGSGFPRGRRSGTSWPTPRARAGS